MTRDLYVDAESWDERDIPPRPRRSEPCIALDNTPVKVRGDALGTEWWRGKQWSVTEHGIECRDGTYFIAKDRLLEDLPRFSWPEHMAGKIWVDIDEFTTAWLVALVLHGYGTRKVPQALLLKRFSKLPPRDRSRVGS